MYTTNNYSDADITALMNKYSLDGDVLTDCLTTVRNNLGNQALDSCLSKAVENGQLSKLTNCTGDDLEALIGKVAAGATGSTIALEYTEAAAKDLSKALATTIKDYTGKATDYTMPADVNVVNTEASRIRNTEASRIL